MTMDITERIRSETEYMTRSERHVASFVLEHKNADGSWREFSWQDIAPYLGT